MRSQCWLYSQNDFKLARDFWEFVLWKNRNVIVPIFYEKTGVVIVGSLFISEHGQCDMFLWQETGLLCQSCRLHFSDVCDRLHCLSKNLWAGFLQLGPRWFRIVLRKLGITKAGRCGIVYNKRETCEFGEWVGCVGRRQHARLPRQYAHVLLIKLACYAYILMKNANRNTTTSKLTK